jgi:hypothetical protein
VRPRYCHHTCTSKPRTRHWVGNVPIALSPTLFHTLLANSADQLAITTINLPNIRTLHSCWNYWPPREIPTHHNRHGRRIIITKTKTTTTIAWSVHRRSRFLPLPTTIASRTPFNHILHHQTQHGRLIRVVVAAFERAIVAAEHSRSFPVAASRKRQDQCVTVAICARGLSVTACVTVGITNRFAIARQRRH